MPAPPASGDRVVIALLVSAGAWWQPEDPALRTWTAPILLEFAAGLALSVCPAILPKWGAWLALGVGVAVLAILPFVGSLDFSGWPRAIELGIPAMLIVAGALGIEWAGGLRAWPPRVLALLILLGDASYALYLIQGLVLPACEKALRHWPMMGALAGIGLSVVAGVVCHLRLEKPLSRWLLALNQKMLRKGPGRDPVAKPAT